MTLRDVLEEYLDNHHDSMSVRSLMQLRYLFGLGGAIASDDAVAPRSRELVLIGHNIIGDLKVLDRTGIELESHFEYVSIADTQVLVCTCSDQICSRGERELGMLTLDLL